MKKAYSAGLLVMCQPEVQEDHAYLYSLIAAVHDVCSYAVDAEGFNKG